MQRITFVGLGAMGEPMAANLIEKGFDVTVVGHLRPEPIERLTALGAKSAKTAAEAAKNCDIAILMLPGSEQVEDAINGPDGLAASLPAGSVVVDCSTSHPASTRKLAAMLSDKQIGYVDAGVTRGVPGAKQGKLAYYIGGEPAHFELVKPALSAMGDTFYYMGKTGSGHETKNLSNALSYATVALVNETLMLGGQLGLELSDLHSALMGGAPSKALEAFGPRIIAREYEPARVSVTNVRAHLGVTSEMAPAGTELTLLPAAKTKYDAVAELGYETADLSAIAELWPKG